MIDLVRASSAVVAGDAAVIVSTKGFAIVSAIVT